MAALEGEPMLFAIRGPISRADLPGLCRRVGTLLSAGARAGGGVVMCDVAGLSEVDAVTVDALARVQLTARRRDCQLRLVNVSQPLRDLVAFTGLGDVLIEA